MKKHTPIFLILLLFAIAVAAGCVGQEISTTPAKKTAIPLFYTNLSAQKFHYENQKFYYENTSLKTVSDAMDFLSEQEELIMGRILNLNFPTMGGYRNYSIDDFRMGVTVKCVNNSMAFFNISTIVRANDSEYWWPWDGEMFVADIPLVDRTQTWKYDNGEVLILVEVCESNIIEINESTNETICPTKREWVWKKPNNIRLLINDDGGVFFAGGRC